MLGRYNKNQLKLMGRVVFKKNYTIWGFPHIVPNRRDELNSPVFKLQ